VRIWTVPYTSEKLALLLVLCNQVDSTQRRSGCLPVQA
jgi:hypothetical protein